MPTKKSYTPNVSESTRSQHYYVILSGGCRFRRHYGLWSCMGYTVWYCYKLMSGKEYEAE